MSPSWHFFFNMRLTILPLLLATAAAFVPQSSMPRATRLDARKDDQIRSTAAAFMTGIFLAVNAATLPPAIAAMDDFAGSSQTLAARSGGRAGGRAYRSTPSARRSTAAPRTTINRQTTIYRTSPTIITPGIGYGGGFGYGGYGYGGFGPSPGFGLYMGLQTIGAINDTLREVRQEQRIARTDEELRQAQMKEAELEMRLRMMENGYKPDQLTPEQMQMMYKMMQQQQMQQQQGSQMQPAN